MRSMSPSLVCFFSTLALGTITGCANDPVHEIDMAVDCADVCNRYRDCFDASYDTDACRARCHDMVDHDPNAANACDACLDGESCVSSFTCADECQGILP